MKGLVVLAVLFASPFIILAALSDSDALKEAERRWGPQAATSIIRRAGNTKLRRCVGYMVGPTYMSQAGCSDGTNWDAAFAAVPVVPPPVENPEAIALDSSRVYCIADNTQRTQIMTLFGTAIDAPAAFINCHDRLYAALVEMRDLNPALFDATMAARGLWLGKD